MFGMITGLASVAVCTVVGTPVALAVDVKEGFMGNGVREGTASEKNLDNIVDDLEKALDLDD